MSERPIITEGGRMATLDQIHKVLSSPDFTDGEKNLVKWQVRQAGGFFTALWEAIVRADEENLALLERAFPSEVEAWRSWQGNIYPSRTGVRPLADRLKAAGLEL